MIRIKDWPEATYVQHSTALSCTRGRVQTCGTGTGTGTLILLCIHSLPTQTTYLFGGVDKSQEEGGWEGNRWDDPQQVTSPSSAL